jgi:N6-adenosine-specific RNA methylase IME4
MCPELDPMRTHPAADLFPLMEGSELAGLVEDIRINGLIEPIIVDGEDRILDGRNRFRACEIAGVEPRYEPYSGAPGGELAFVISKNLKRRHLNESQRAMIGVRLANMKQGQRTDLNLPANAERFSQEAAAKMMGVSVDSLGRALVVLEHGTPEQIEAVERGNERVGAVERQIKLHKQAAAIRAEPVPLPTGRWRVILIDPAWPFGTEYDPETRRVGSPYPEMSLDEIAALDVPSIAHADCVLWLCITRYFLLEGAQIPILAAWGFEEKELLTWGKDRFGTGSWLRGQTEHCVMAVRGHPTVTLTNQSTLLVAPMRRHSQKPDELYELIESLCPASRYCSLFHRGPLRDLWDGHGDECGEQAEDDGPAEGA